MFLLLQVGHFGLFCHPLAVALAAATLSGEGGAPISSLNILNTSFAKLMLHSKNSQDYTHKFMMKDILLLIKLKK